MDHSAANLLSARKMKFLFHVKLDLKMRFSVNSRSAWVKRTGLVITKLGSAQGGRSPKIAVKAPQLCDNLLPGIDI
jgi:hypothetical protein